MEIYVKFEIPKTVREFLKLLFNNVHGGDSSARTNVETYLDKDCTTIQCYAGKYRSFRETCDCVQTYFPKVTDKAIFRILLTLNFKSKDNKPLYLYHSYCTTVSKPVFYFATSKPAYYNIINHTDTGVETMSWRDIYGMWKLIDDATIMAFLEKYKDR